MSKEELLKVVGTKFFVWFLTLSILIIGMTLILMGNYDHLLSERIIGGLTLTPLAIPLNTIFNAKGERQEQEFKLSKVKLRNENKANKRQARNDKLELLLNYKLRKYEIKHS